MRQPNKMSNRLVFRMLAAGWMVLIFLLSAQPGSSMPSMFNGLDKVLHALFYGILGYLLARSFVPPKVTSWERIFIITILVTAYGMTDEYHQASVPGREASIWDVLADGVGGFAAAWSMHWRYRRVIKPA